MMYVLKPPEPDFGKPEVAAGAAELAAQRRAELEQADSTASTARRTHNAITLGYACTCVNEFALVGYVDPEGPKPRDYYELLELAASDGAVADAARRATLHLFETTGGFVQAALRLSDGEADWHATSDDAQFDAALKEAKMPNGHSRLIYSEDGSSSILDHQNATSVIRESGVGSVSLVTAVGGGSQAGLLRVLAAELWVALHTLAERGCLVLRFDDNFDAGADQILWCCCEVFERVSVHRLHTSPVCTPQRYVVGTGFCGYGPKLKRVIAALEPVAFGGEQPAQPLAEPPSPAAVTGLLCATAAIAEQQTKAILDAVALTCYFKEVGVDTMNQTRLHSKTHFTTSPACLGRARQLLAEIQPLVIGP